MKLLRLIGLNLMAFVLVIFYSNMSFAANQKDLIGTWSYSAPYAPYEYSNGKLIFAEKEGKLEGKIKIGEYEIEMRNLKLEGENVTFGTYVEGEYVNIKLVIKKDEFAGKASYSEGTIDVNGKKEK